MGLTSSTRSAASFADKVVYQIYPRSFYDSDGDGVGDLAGVTAKLDYLESLGVDYLWLTPFFVSPQRDNGYDIADYRSIDSRFGTMDDFEELVAQARERGIGIMLDMVFNHTSTEHEWFRRALAGDERYQAYYFFREGSPDRPPTNWSSNFGGPAWEWVPELQRWYLHLFDRTQADLDWSNPEVREELADIARFWKDKGVSGFRFDVINLVSKPEVFEDDPSGNGSAFYTDGPHVHEFLRELVTRAGIEGMVTVGELPSTSLEACLEYTRPENHELSMVFSFDHLMVDYRDGDKWSLMDPDLALLQRIFAERQEGMQAGGGWNALYWDNHDQPRAVSRFCDDGALRVPSAKMLAMVGQLMRGTPYIYQGDEIGMTSGHCHSIGSYRDVESLNYYKILRERGLSEPEVMDVMAERSRDNGRLPMQWSSAPSAGFTTGEPWIPLACDAPGCDQAKITVEAARADDGSILAFYQRLVELRHDMSVIATGKIKFLDAGAVPVISYARFGDLPVGGRYDARSATDEDILAPGSLLVLGNFSAHPAAVGERVCRLLGHDGWEYLLSGYGDRTGAVGPEALELRPYEGITLIRR